MACLLIAATGAFSKQPQPQRDSPTIRAEARVVTVNVAAVNAKGEPVRDLAEDNFSIFDDRQPQQIAFFSAFDSGRPVRVISRKIPDTYTNIPPRDSAPPGATILLFDTLNSRWESQGYGLQHVRSFLRQIQPGDHLGIYILGEDLQLAHDFRSDSSALIAAIARYDETHSHSQVAKRAAGRPGDLVLDRFLAGKYNRLRFIGRVPTTPAYNADKGAIAAQLTTAYLELIGRQLSSVAGRKTLVWITDGIGAMTYFEDSDLDTFLLRWRGQAGLNLPQMPSYIRGPDVERLIRLMNGAGIAVYTVDARGLETEDLDFRNTNPLTSLGSNTDPVENLISRIPEPNSSLIGLAERTGGRAFYNRNDLETGIRRALDDSRFTYSLAYYPDHNQWKGEWRKIEVKVNRPGVTVLARGGYFALPDPLPVPPKDRFAFFGQIAASPIDSTMLPVTVHLAASGKPQAAQLHAQVHLEPASMLARQENGRWSGQFELMFMQIGPKNKLLDATHKDVDADLDAAEYAKVSQQGWDLLADLKFMPAAQQLCVILHDKSSDSVGSVHIPLASYAAASASH